jgi:hypothetical protein
VIVLVHLFSGHHLAWRAALTLSAGAAVYLAVAPVGHAVGGLAQVVVLVLVLLVAP